MDKPKQIILRTNFDEKEDDDEHNKPKQNNNDEEAELIEHEKSKWILKYKLPFKPSSMWKTLFVRLRNKLVENDEEMEMFDEIYWIDGFVFHFGFDLKQQNFKNKKKKQILRTRTIVKMNIHKTNKNEDEKENKSKKMKNEIEVNFDELNPQLKLSKIDEENVAYLMKISIETNDISKRLIELIEITILEYFSEWIKTSSKIKFSKQLIDRPRTLDFKDQNLKIIENEENKLMKGICFNCGLWIAINNKAKKCDKCSSSNFMILQNFIVDRIVTSGIQGRVYKAI